MSEPGDASVPPHPSVPTPPSGLPPKQLRRAHDLLRKLAEPHKIGGWTGFVVLALALIGQWQGVFSALLPAVEAVGGRTAVVMMQVFFSPVVMIVLAFWSGYSLWATSVYQQAEDRRFVVTLTWILLAAFVVPLSSIALFGYVLSESKLPEVVKYYELQATERRLSEVERNGLYAALRKVAGQMPAFSVTSARNPESMQYANDFMGVFFGVGLHLTNGPRQSAGIDPIDLMSPVFRGLFIGVKDRQAPSPAALVFRDALKEGGVSAYFVNMPVATEDQFLLVVGLR